jgi:hypothetical protein
MVEEVTLAVQAEEIAVQESHPRGKKFYCPEHVVQLVSVLWPEPHIRFTILFARFAINVLYNQVVQTKLEPIKKLACTLKERINNFAIYCTYGITNLGAEGINSKIMSIKRRAGGFRNRDNFK